MPVMRLPGRVKSRISADAGELDEWRSGRNPAQEQEADSSGRLGLWSWIAIGLIVCSVVAGVRLWLDAPGRKPARTMLQGSDLIVLNAKGQELWRHTFPDGIVPDNPPSEIQDIDGDSREEILFRHSPLDVEKKGGVFYCFSSNGAIKWKFAPDRSVTTRNRQLAGRYFIADSKVFSNIKPNGPAVAIASIHGWSHPGQVAVLDARGKLIGEYMHSGHLGHLALMDIDGDGKEELLAAGVNNGHDKATLVVFDPSNVHGASTQPSDDGRQILGLGTGTEKIIVRFPRACFSEKLEPFNRVFKVITGETLRVYVSENIYESGEPPYVVYELDRNFNVRGISVSDMFDRHHRELELRGLLDHSFSPQEKEALKQIAVIRKSN